MYTRKQALSLAKQFRTCPPLFIRNNPDFKEENENHLKICPFCSVRSIQGGSTEGVLEWQALSESYKKQFQEDRGSLSILPGQIRQVKSDLGCWRDDLYYNPPLVLVLNVPDDEISHGVQVAQVWQDLALASPGDLIPPENLIAGFEELFIETWNVYTLRKSDLGAYLGEVPSKVVDGALKMNEDPEHLPDYARRALPLIDEDPRLYFQELEIETGYTFAFMAATALMDEEKRAVFFTSSARALVKAIKEYIPTIDWEWLPETVEDCLAFLTFPVEHFALSAEDDDYKKISAVYLNFKNETIKQLKPIECIIHHVDDQSDAYTISGEIPSLPDNLEQGAFRCHIKNTVERSLFRGRLSWNGQEKYFIAEFDRPLQPNDKVSIIIFHDESDAIASDGATQ